MKKLKSEKGMLIVEATIVFPVMFLVIILMIFLGNAYYQKCRVEALVAEMAFDGAAYCSDPMLETVDTKGTVPGFETNPQPYRYFTNMSSVVGTIETTLRKRLGNISSGLFSAMKPTDSHVDVEYKGYFIYATFMVDLDYKVPVPVRLLGAEDILSLEVKTHAETAVTDVPEFIRNVNMIEDYLLQSGKMDKINELIDKAKNFFG